MRLGITKEPDWEYVGALLANSDDKNQTAFFKAFIKEAKSWGTAYQIQGQLAHVNLALTPDERETLAMLSLPE